MKANLFTILMIIIPAFLFCQNTQTECEFHALKGGQIICTNPDIMPSPQGGIEMLYKAIYQTIKYPSRSKDSAVGSKTIVKFVVDELGRIKNKEIDRQDIKGLDLPNAMFKAIESLRWSPGKCCGTPVAVQYYLPLTICLQ